MMNQEFTQLVQKFAESVYSSEDIIEMFLDDLGTDLDDYIQQKQHGIESVVDRSKRNDHFVLHLEAHLNMDAEDIRNLIERGEVDKGRWFDTLTAAALGWFTDVAPRWYDIESEDLHPLLQARRVLLALQNPEAPSNGVAG